MSNTKEIGGDFELPLSLFCQPPLTDLIQLFGLREGHYVFLRGGRAALRYALEHEVEIGPDRPFLLPSYLCQSILEPFRVLGLRWSFYRVRRDLTIDLEHLRTQMQRPSSGILLIHYLGFRHEESSLSFMVEARERGLTIIEDNVQALLSDGVGEVGNYSICSFKKFLPVPDGGYLKSRSPLNPLKTTQLICGYDEYWARRAMGLLYKNIYVSSGLGSKEFFLRSLEESEKIYDAGVRLAGMTDYSHGLMERLDFDLIRSRRRSNFLLLLEGVKQNDKVYPLFQNLPEGVCPLGFPILALDRDGLRQQFIQEHVFPPIHWELPEEVNPEEFKDSIWLSRNILTIPCDQRYGDDDMSRIIEVIRRAT